MKKINKKGFTLVELLAVLVVLAIIVLLAVNIINSRVKEAKKNSVEVNANNYVKAVNGVAAISQNVGEDMEKGTYQVRDLNKQDIKISGEKPRKGYLVLENYEVTYGCLMYDNYSAIILNGKTSSVEKLNCNDFKVNAEFAYKGSEEVYNVQISGLYKIEVWGAQGGNADDTYVGGYGGYSVGYVQLKKGDKLYINVGGQGTKLTKNESGNGGYNGGGNVTLCLWSSSSTVEYCGTGGGASSVAKSSGLLSSLSSDVQSIIIVAGGGGGGEYTQWSSYYHVIGGSGGGFTGGKYTSTTNNSSTINSYTAASQSGAGSIKYANNPLYSASFGQGSNSPQSGGGGGFYGGAGTHGGSGGGSGYIGYSSLYNKAMYCYSCTENVGINTKTVSNQCVSTDPLEKCSKQGNGYAKISYIGNKNNNPYTHLTVYYDHGLMYQNISINHNFDGTRATFTDDHMTLGTSSYQVLYTDVVDLSKYNSVIYKRTNFTNQNRSGFKEDPYRVNNCTGCKGYTISWTSLGNDYYVGDVSDKMDNDLHFKTDEYNGDGRGDIYYIAFSTKTVEEIVADHSFLN